MSLFATMISSFAQAPDTLWTHTYGGSWYDEAHSVQQTTDGGYIVAGCTEPLGEGEVDFYLVKTDSQGDTLWTHTYGGSNSEEAYSIRQTADGGYAVAGWTTSFGAGDYDFYLVKTNGQGDTLWTRTYGGSSYDIARSIQPTTDGGYILAGYTASFGAGTPSSPNFQVVKTNGQGDTLWTRTYGGSDYDMAYSIQQTTDGGYIVAGSTRSVGGIYLDFYLVKTDSQGDTLWTRTYGGSRYDEAYSVQQTDDGGYIMAGWTDSFGAYSQDFYLVKTDSEGNTQWTRIYGGSDSEEAYSVQQAFDGGYIVAGYTASFGAGVRDFYLVKTNSQGDTLWTRTYGGNGYDVARSTSPTDDGGYVVAGSIYYLDSYTTDFYLVKTEPEYPNVGYVTLISPGPPDWDYRLNWISGAISQFKFTDFCPGTVGSVTGPAGSHWTAINYPDSIVFTSLIPLTSGILDTFTLSHPWCSDVVTWIVGDSSGEVDGPLPVELISFDAVASAQGIRVSFSTASETNNDRFEILRGERAEGEFIRIAVLPSQGNSATEQGYEYTDTDVNPGQTYWYYLADVDLNGSRAEHREMMVSATALDLVAVPSSYSLSVYPNPFNPSTTISFSLLEAGAVRVAVYDVGGRWIQTLVDEKRSAGNHRVTFDARELPSGVYFVRMESGTFQATRKIVLMR
ncbi:T9SS type A sorting domain-containing protein [bacterium]|nr:T9SS type A sorting domain-containing protein [bacterium]